MVRRAGSLGLFVLHVQNPRATGVAELCQKTQQAQWRGSNLANRAHWGKPKKQTQQAQQAGQAPGIRASGSGRGKRQQTQQAQQAPRNASGAGIRSGKSGAVFPPQLGQGQAGRVIVAGRKRGASGAGNIVLMPRKNAPMGLFCSSFLLVLLYGHPVLLYVCPVGYP